MRRASLTISLACAGLSATPAHAQRAQENAITSANDGFGATVGNERVGVYTTTNVRGFSPITAGNRRLEGLYFDLGGNGLTSRLTTRSTVRVGLPALTYPFPAPSGIVDYELREPGRQALLSVVAGLPVYGGYSVEIDGQAPLTDGLRIGGGIAAGSNVYADGRSTYTRSAAILPSISLGKVEVTAFAGVARTGGSVPAIMVTNGPILPPIVDTSEFRGQSWFDSKQVSRTYGLLAAVPLADRIDLNLGAFESRSVRFRSFANLFLNVQPDGSADEIVISDPRLPARWTSGEARLSWRVDGAQANHRLILAVRARDKRLESGGSSTRPLGKAVIGTTRAVPRPAFTYGTPSVNEIDQVSLGMAYIGRPADSWDVNVGVQRVDYRSALTVRDDRTRVDAKPWTYNATVAYAPADWLGLYAGLATGLEESAAAPAGAANRDEPVPASKTRQVDAGVRILWGGMRLVTGLFQLERPYFSVGGGNLYEALGTVRNRGVELSLTGNPLNGLSVVTGVVLMDPRVVGEAFEAGRVGLRPVASTTRTARIDAEYATSVKGLSVTAAAQLSGAIAASTTGYAALGGEQLKIPASTIFDVGARYRFAMGTIPVTLRGQLLNLFDTRRLILSSSNAFTPSDTRRFTLQLAADF